MNYEQARERKADGRWDWTNMRDGLIWATDYCAGFKPYAEICAALGMPNSPKAAERHDRYKDKYHTDGHATREEAERCHYDYQIDHAREFKIGPDTQRKCAYPDCEAWTQNGLQIGNYELYLLCDGHRDRDGLERVAAFKPGAQEIHS